jgi:hypothetical protein
VLLRRSKKLGASSEAARNRLTGARFLARKLTGKHRLLIAVHGNPFAVSVSIEGAARMMNAARLLLPPFITALAACGTTEATLPYAPTAAVQAATAARPAVAVSDRVANERQAGREDPRWIGTIRSGIGTPLKVLRADQPVDQVVARAFADGLAARGLHAPSGAAPHVLSITIHEFDANQYARREATADFSIVLAERATGRVLWRDRHRAYRVDGSVVTVNAFAFASMDDFRRTAAGAMSEAVDALLDKPGFRAALRRGG